MAISGFNRVQLEENGKSSDKAIGTEQILEAWGSRGTHTSSVSFLSPGSPEGHCHSFRSLRLWCSNKLIEKVNHLYPGPRMTLASPHNVGDWLCDEGKCCAEGCELRGEMEELNLKMLTSRFIASLGDADNHDKDPCQDPDSGTAWPSHWSVDSLTACFKGLS